MTLSAVPPLLPALLAGTLPDGPCDAIELRVSAQNPKELKANVNAASTKLRSHPAIAHLQTLDVEALLLDKSAAGERLRRSVGLIEIRRANAHRYALNPGQLMGWALPLREHAAVILMLFDSAADPTVDNPDEPLPGNAVSSVLAEVCLMDEIHRLYVAEWDRWVRSPHFGAAVRAAAQLGGVDIYEGTERIDITTTEGTMVAGMKDGTASGERNGIRKRTTRGVLTKILGVSGRIEWPYAEVLLFPAYELAYKRQRGDDGKTHRTRYLQSATGQHADGWQAWAHAVAEGGTFLAAGKHLAAHKVPVRGTRHVNPDGTAKTYDQLTEQQLERASRTLAEHVRLLRAREYMVDKGVPFAIRRDQDFEGFAVDHDDRRPGRFGSIQRVVDLPEHCIDLTDDQWDAWERRIHDRTPRDTRTDGPRAPFADVRQQWFVTAAGERREAGDPDWTHNLRIVANGDTYEVFRRAREEAHNDRGELRGWNSREGEQLFSVRRRDLDTGYARAGIAQAAAHIGAFEPVVIDPRPLPDPAEQERRRTERLAELEHLIVVATDAVDDAGVVHERATERGRGIEQATASLVAARTDLKVLTEEQEALVLSPAPTETAVPARTVQVDTSTPARLFGILDGAAGHRMPRAVSDLLHRLSRARVDVRPDPLLPRMLRITDVLDWPAEDGTVVPLRICFPVENRKRDLDEAARENARRETAAALILRDGYTVDAVAEQLDWTRAETVTRVRAWLKDHHPVNVPSRGGRSAIVDCPSAETKRAVWDALTGAVPAEGDQRFAELVVPRYLAQVRHANSWVRRDVTLERRILDVITTLLGQGIDVDAGLHAADLAGRAGCTTQQVMFLCDGPGDRYRGILERVPGPGRRVRPRRCAAGHPLLHVLPTLETEAWSGLLCQTCRATPDGTDLPPGYFELWNGPDGQHHDLGKTPGTVLTEAPPPVAPGARPRPMLTIGEAAAYLQVSTSALRQWSDDGLVACEQRPRRYDQRVLDSADVWALAARWQATYGQRTTDDGRLSLAQATERLGVPEHYLRAFLLETGRLAAARGGVRGNTLLFQVTDVDAVPQEWRDRHAADLIGIGAAAEAVGMTVPQLRAAAIAGRIPSLVTDGGTRRFRLTDLAAHPRQVPLQSAEPNPAPRIAA